MIYLAGCAGFVFGFFFGQIFLSHILRDYSRQEIIDLMKDKSARFKYGMINWGMAFMWAFAFVEIYRLYF